MPPRKENAAAPQSPAEVKDAPKTLAGVSNANVESFLGKSRTQRRSQAKKQKTLSLGVGLAQPRYQDPAGDCGAPAQAAADTDPSLADAAELKSEEEDWEDADLADDDDAPVLSGETFHLTAGDAEETGEGSKRKRARPVITKQDRERALLSHRSHLLCLLGRGLLLDAATSDPVVQAVAASLLPSDLAASVPAGSHPNPAVLPPLMDWYRNAIAVDLSAQAVPESESSCRDVLQSCAANKKGGPEAVTGLFAAVLRAHGLLARLVRVLDALPVKPSAKEKALLAHAPCGRRASKQPQHGSDSAAKQDGHATEQQGAQSGDNSKPDESAAKPAKRKRGSATQVDADAPSEHAATEDESEREGKGARGRGRGRGKAVKSGMDRSAEEGAAAKTPGSGRGRGRGKKGALSPPHQKAEPDAAQDAEELAASRRKGDIEFDNQISMAMQASAAASSSAALPDLPEPSKTPSTQPQAGAASAAKGKGASRHTHMGSAWTKQQAGGGDAGNAWVEVYCASAAGGKWVPVDPLMAWVDRADSVEAACARMCPLAYVVAFAGGGAKDVTQRYVASYAAAEKHRDSAWFADTLKPLRQLEVAATRQHMTQQQTAAALQPNGNARGRAHTAEPPKQLAADMVAAREDQELQARAAAERRSLPNTIDGFRNHERYVLQRHIGRYQALTPGAKVEGVHKGEAFYARDAVAELHTAEQWQRHGREVVPREEPCKLVRKRGTKAPAPVGQPPAFDDDVVEEDEEAPSTPYQGIMTKLYGRWQTCAWAPPAASNGIVPKNERGNVHVPPFASSLPEGTVHLRLPRLGGLCKQLGIDYAPAMLGFDSRGGRSFPVIDGVVVCQMHEHLLIEAHAAAERERIARAEAKAAAEAAACWRKLLNALVARLRVQKAHNTPAWDKAEYYADTQAGKGGKRKAAAGKLETMVEEDGRGFDAEVGRQNGTKGKGKAAAKQGDMSAEGKGTGRKGGKGKAAASSEQVPKARTEQPATMAVEVEEL